MCTRLCGHPSLTLIYGCFNVINLLLATSFVIIPYWFYHAGLLFGVVSLSFCLVSCGIASFWVLECLGRTSLIHRNNKYPCLDREVIASIDCDRNFEFSEMSKIITGKTCEFIVLLVIIVTDIPYIVAGIVSGSQALAVNIPINTTFFTTCNSSDFDAAFLPVGNCLNWYRMVVVTVGIIGTVLSCLNSKNQIQVLVFLSILRFIVMGYMICFSIFVLRNEITKNYTIKTNFVTHFEFDKGMVATGAYFSFVSLPNLIPSMTHSIKNKSQLRSMLVLSLIFSTIILTCYGSALAFAFGSNIHQNSFLNFKPYTMGNHTTSLKVISHLILLYPFIDGISNFIYGVILASNLTFSMMTRKDFSEVSKKISYRLLNLLIYLCYSILSTAICLFTSNIVTVVCIVGIGSYISDIVFPSLLQITSNRKCSQLFTQSPASNLENKSILRKAIRFLLKSSYPTPYSSFYSSYFMVIALSGIVTLVFFTSFYYIVASFIL